MALGLIAVSLFAIGALAKSQAPDRKTRIGTHAGVVTAGAAGITVRLTRAGRSNYLAVRREWAAALADAVENDARGLDRALDLLTDIAAGLIAMRPEKPGRNMSRVEA